MPLPGARKVYGQLLSRDFNPLDIPPITANSLTPLIASEFTLNSEWGRREVNRFCDSIGAAAKS